MAFDHETDPRPSHGDQVMSSKISPRSRAALESLSETARGDGSLLLDLLVSELHDNPDNPRTQYDDDDIAALADSIRAEGLIQPLKVRRRKEGGYTILVGHSRKRAALLVGLERVPAILKQDEPGQSVEDARIADMVTMFSENKHRANVAPLDLANHISKMLSLLGNTHGSKGVVAKALHVLPAFVSRHLALLDLPDDIKALARDNLVVDPVRLAALGALDDDTRLAEIARLRGGAIDAPPESLVVNAAKPDSAPASKPAKRTRPAADPNITHLEQHIASVLATKATIKPGPKGPSGKGMLILHYSDPEVLQGLLEKMGIAPEA
jgi:ParB family chromosome partitioning protein